MSITFGLYDDETRAALLAAIDAGIAKALDDEWVLAEMAEEIGIEYDEDTGLTRRGQFSMATRVPLPIKETQRPVGRLRQRLLRKAASLT